MTISNEQGATGRRYVEQPAEPDAPRDDLEDTLPDAGQGALGLDDTGPTPATSDQVDADTALAADTEDAADSATPR